ncbi:metallophosphoesterase [Pontibacter sp. Tf4]|uniref:metallophosphoesterase family protein n=1 Tax=Pontibacter sp. Tf4 TaxID=2761620 RepID=UPI001623DBC2|nr:metallophosphoesterase [Pontibacter sp. Tf4]MBB6612584.1 metallophosphoesterase [Pontibacter sp. Tf4]
MQHTTTKFNYRNKITLTTLVLSVMALQACDKFEYSPYEVRLNDNEKELNLKNIERIKAQNIPADATITFALISDTQGFYKETEATVNHLNKRNDVQFVLHNGDITDFGVLKEYRLINDRLSKLKFPLVTVIGNHDATNNGKQVYREMYGPYDFSFVAGHAKFIFLNTNNWEFDGAAPNLAWLETELQDRANYKQVFVLSHIPPHDDSFGADKLMRYRELMDKYNVSMSIHGHGHNFETYQYKEGGTKYMNVGDTQDKEYIVMRANGNSVTFERVSTADPDFR